MLSVQRRFGNAGAGAITKDLVFEGREHEKKPSHRAAHRGRQIERFGERQDSDTQFLPVLLSVIEMSAAPKKCRHFFWRRDNPAKPK
jgi:hypothetical protein